MGTLTLDSKALIVSIFIGIILWIFAGLDYLLVMLVFFVLSVHLTGLGYYEKKTLGVYDYERGVFNVLSNGIFPLIFAVLSHRIGIFPFLGSVAAITADKFGSEAGVLGEDPIELFTFKKVKPGKSGAISLFGTLASIAGSILIALTGWFLFGLSGYEVLIITISGVLGSFVDSVFGFFEERGFGNKYTSNLFGSLAGGIVAYLLTM